MKKEMEKNISDENKELEKVAWTIFWVLDTYPSIYPPTSYEVLSSSSKSVKHPQTSHIL